jgi:hypothetical protein
MYDKIAPGSFQKFYKTELVSLHRHYLVEVDTSPVTEEKGVIPLPLVGSHLPFRQAFIFLVILDENEALADDASNLQRSARVDGLTESAFLFDTVHGEGVTLGEFRSHLPSYLYIRAPLP